MPIRPHFFFLISSGTSLAESRRSRTCPKLDLTLYRSPRNRSSVRAFVGDSTITRVFAIVPLHPNTFCQSERTGPHRRALPDLAAPARRGGAANAASRGLSVRQSRRDRRPRQAPASRVSGRQGRSTPPGARRRTRRLRCPPESP